MGLSSAETLTRLFYEWEKRGRGWYAFDSLVDIEPPFVTFNHHIRPYEQVDDGMIPGVWDGLKAFFSKPKQDTVKPEPLYPLEPIPYEVTEGLCLLALSLPRGPTVKQKEAEQLLSMFSVCKLPVSFEIVANSNRISLQLVCSDSDQPHVQSQLKAYFPDCIVQEQSASLNSILQAGKPTHATELGLAEEFMRPLYSATDFTIDPLTGIIGAMEQLQDGEQLALQVLFKGAVDPWAESIWNAVTDGEGKSFFSDAPEMPKLAREKISSPLFGVAIRTVGQAPANERAAYLSDNLARIVIQASQSSSNSLIKLSGNDITQDEQLCDVVYRQSHRLGMMLNSQELATLVHLPSASITTSKLAREFKRTKAAPANTEYANLVLGVNVHQGKERTAAIDSAQRLRHMHIIGATGTGKSTLLQNLIAQDVETGRGFAVLDPHGDLVESVISSIPEKRIEDVVVIDPSDALFPVAFNILQAHSETEKEVLASDLVAIFRRLSTTWGDAMNSVFANGILAFLESSEGGTLMDLRRFFVEKQFRDSFLKTVSDPSIVYYWTKEYPLLKSNSIGSILTRMDSFLRPKLIRNMVAQKRGLDFVHLMDSNKIVLVKLPQGLIGTENSYLLGSIFVSKMYQSAMARQGKEAETRKDFALYVDEFQNFIVPSMAHILSGARKYRLGLVLAHQDMQQLVKEDAELASAVTSNAGTRICFRLGDIDAKRFESGFSSFDANDLQNMGTGEAVARIERSDADFNLRIIPYKNNHITDATENVIAKSREKYNTQRELVEQALYQWQETATAEMPISEPVIEDIKLQIINQQPVTTSQSAKEIINPSDTIEYLVKQKEQSQHRYIQTLIKRMAESRGFKATIEEPTPDGKGRVDVSLERNGKRVACEIGVTTNKDWEVHNIEKCLSAGYDLVFAVSSEQKALNAMRRKITERIDKRLLSKVAVLDTETLFMVLDAEIAKEANKERRVKGYRVKVKYEAVSEKEMRDKRNSIANAIVKGKAR